MTQQNYHGPIESSTPLNQVARVLLKRTTKRQAIEDFFRAHPGQKFSSATLHAQFGSSFRSRVSDINRDPSASVTISNAVAVQESGTEASVYWSEVR
jgi:hypothetical protein